MSWGLFLTCPLGMKMTPGGLSRFSKAAAQVVEDLWSEGTALFDGQPVACAVSRGAVGGDMILGGEIPDALLKLRIRKANLQTPPLKNVTVFTFEDRKWRVDEVQDSYKDESWALTCIPANRS